MRLLAFFKSPLGNVVLFVAFVAVGGALLYRNHVRAQVQAAQLTKATEAPPSSLRESILPAGQVFKPPALIRQGNDDETAASTATAGKASVPPARDPRGSKPDPKPRVLPISLVASGTHASDGALSSVYAPYGRLVPCETVLTLESSKLDTPVVGLVTEDVWHDGRLIIPAGAEVHGRASVDRSRERIAASGKWVVVWRDGSPLNGTELVLEGIALEREKDDVSGEYGLRDGSAGLVGQLLKTDDWQEIKLFASTFLAGAASGLEQLQNQATGYGLAQVPVASGRDAALQGTAAVLNAYARQIQDAIARDGFFVRVPAGHQFYLYVTETIDQAKGTRGNVANAELWRKDHAN